MVGRHSRARFHLLRLVEFACTLQLYLAEFTQFTKSTLQELKEDPDGFELVTPDLKAFQVRQ